VGWQALAIGVLVKCLVAWPGAGSMAALLYMHQLYGLYAMGWQAIKKALFTV